jgi:hypothetical protein
MVVVVALFLGKVGKTNLGKIPLCPSVVTPAQLNYTNFSRLTLSLSNFRRIDATIAACLNWHIMRL